MSNPVCALIWFVAAAVAAALGFFILQSNLVFALCFAGITVAFLAIAGSCLLRDPPAESVREPVREPETGGAHDWQARRKWHPR